MGVVFSCKVTTTKTNVTLVKKRGVTWVVISYKVIAMKTIMMKMGCLLARLGNEELDWGSFAITPLHCGGA
jgi:hypothetical protein